MHSGYQYVAHIVLRVDASVPARRRFFLPPSDDALVAEYLPHYVWLYEPEYGVFGRRGDNEQSRSFVSVKLSRPLARTTKTTSNGGDRV